MEQHQKCQHNNCAVKQKSCRNEVQHLMKNLPERNVCSRIIFAAIVSRWTNINTTVYHNNNRNNYISSQKSQSNLGRATLPHLMAENGLAHCVCY